MLLALVLIPFIASITILLGATARPVTIGAAAINCILGLYVALCPSCAGELNLPILAEPKIHLGLGLNGMNTIMLLLTVIITLAASLHGACPKGKEKLWHSSILFISTSAIAAFLSTELISFFLCYQLALIPTFLSIKTLGKGGNERPSIAWKTAIFSLLGSMLLCTAMLLAALQNASFVLEDLLPATQYQNTIALLFILGCSILTALFPFHSWATEAYASAPAPIAMLHSGVFQKIGIYALLKIGLVIAPQGMQHWLNLLLILLMCHIFWVGMITINQKRISTILSHASVMQIGYVFLAVAVMISHPQSAFPHSNGIGLAQSAAILFLFAHGVSMAMGFSLADRIQSKTGTMELNQLSGLSTNMPKLHLLFGITVLAIVGMPGLANFAGKIMLFFSGFEYWNPEKPLGTLQIITFITIGGTLISMIYMLRLFNHLFRGDLTRHSQKATDINLSEQMPALLLALILFAVGIYPHLLLNLLR